MYLHKHNNNAKKCDIVSIQSVITAHKTEHDTTLQLTSNIYLLIGWKLSHLQNSKINQLIKYLFLQVLKQDMAN